jgi:predicted Fe-Mo cluster-binding NifX family protein
MKLALTAWNNRIAPVFDSAGSLLVLEMQNGICQHRETVSIAGKDLAEKARTLRNHGVSELICGAISYEAESLVRLQGISIFPFIAGDLEMVIQAWCQHRLGRKEFSMPGCMPVRRRQGQRRGWYHGMPPYQTWR